MTLETTKTPAPEWAPTVVIIDDDSISIRLLAGVLEQEGYHTFSAPDGALGRALVREKRPDLVLLDMHMPGENGIDACNLLKKDPAVADIPVIFLTADGAVDTKVSSFAAGAVDYVTKPFHPLEVLARVRVHIRIRRTLAAVVAAQVAKINGLAATQKMIMPDPAEIPEARFAAYYQALHEAGGDFYDVLPVANGVFDYVVADVCDHDLGSSLFTSALKVLLHEGRVMLNSPLETLRMVNLSLRAAFLGEKYVTLAYARINRRRRTLTTISAGHPPIILWSAKKDSMTLLPCQGDVLGSFDEIVLTEYATPMETGDRVFMYTDGLIERSGKSRDSGIAHLAGVCRSLRDKNLVTLVDAVQGEVFGAGEERSDDLLLLAIDV